MKGLMPVVSYVGLALVLVPALAYLAGSMEKGTMTNVMLAGTIVWFGSVPFWMGRKTPE
jgi:hypothetical protein